MFVQFLAFNKLQKGMAHLWAFEKLNMKAFFSGLSKISLIQAYTILRAVGWFSCIGDIIQCPY